MAREAAKALNFDVKVFKCVSYVTDCDLSLDPRTQQWPCQLQTRGERVMKDESSGRGAGEGFPS
jgi:hypothetical protein